MKRVIKSAESTGVDLSFVFDGKTYYLPRWCEFWPADEVEKAKQSAIDGMKARRAKYSDDDSVVPSENEEDIVRKLKEAGYTRSEIDSIIYDISRGMTLDAAMQNIREGF
jgi:hypothetical protein